MSEAIAPPRWFDKVNPLITRKNERYKYADFGFLNATNYLPVKKSSVEYLREVVDACRLKRAGEKMLVLVNGYYAPELSDVVIAPGVTVLSMNDAKKAHGDVINKSLEIDVEKYPFASVNAQQYNDGIFIHVADKCHVEAPIHVLSLGAGAEPFYSQVRNIVAVGNESKIELFYEYISDTVIPYVMNDVDVIRLGKNAHIELNKVQHESVKAKHLSHTFISQQQNSSSRYNSFALGGDFYRDDIVADLLEPGAECRAGGFYQLNNDNQYVDNHVDINHKNEHTNSEMHYKGVLDKKSTAVFNGRLHVEKGAQKIVAYQENHNILLAKAAEVYSKPELEIYADDVKCKHGATIGQINQDALFYMRSRGIGKVAARNMLLQGFAQDSLLKVSSPIVRERIKKLMGQT